MDQHINLVLKGVQSRTDIVKSFKTSYHWFGTQELLAFHADFIDFVECDIDVKDISKLNKVVFCTML